MKGFICRFHRDEGGATAIEYGLICALIFLAIVTSIGRLYQEAWQKRKDV